MSTPQPGEVWIDSRPSTDRAEWRDATKFRRVLLVESFEPDRNVVGKSSWQERRREQWADMGYPPPRTTRIQAAVFLRRFHRDED
jgi:hypothetical protein